MKLIHGILTGAGLSLLLAGGALAAETRSADEMGLSKTSVFDTPTPSAPPFSKASPGTSEPMPRYFPGAPPQIPHQIEGFVPIKAAANACMGCHNRPDLWQQPPIRGLPTPMPESHYTDLRASPHKVQQQVVGARFICTQCHAPQAEAEPLVENTLR
jgi:cytochrome c-type protein NapB